MKQIIVLLMTSIIFSNFMQAQNLYMPRNIQMAYKKGTRSMDGKPGKNYWQNGGRYDIIVTANPPDREIRGTETITYFNNSPDTLKNPAIRLVLNIHQAGAAREYSTNANYLTSGLQIDQYIENGVTKTWNNLTTPMTWQNIHLDKPLLPHDSLHLTFSWHYQISLQSNREGMIDSTTYFLAYFYPRVSVYDDYNGWDRLNFTDAQEFYNDFNDYTLTVKVPENFVVWATGDLLNPNEVLQSEMVKRVNESMHSDSVIHIAGAKELSEKIITTQQPTNSWKWKASHISDVTVGISDHYFWDASSTIVDESTKRRTSVQSAYNPKAQDFRKSVQNGTYAISWYSKQWPGVPFPFPKMSIFQGFADMEYPMMVNDASTYSAVFSRLVQDHEIAHSYFPFYMGINESRYAFMDEGWATTLELLIGRSEMSVEQADNFYKQFRVNGWIHDNSSEEDLPIITPANSLSGVAYGNNAYGKPSLGYLALMDLLGPDLFKQCLHEYMNRWHGKHPIPWDFFYTFNDVTGKNLNWFWTSWYFSNDYIDFAIRQVSQTANGYTVQIQNIGGYPAPFDLLITYDDGSNATIHQTPALWQGKDQQATVDLSTKKKIKTLKLSGGIFMDADESNNSWSQ